MRTQKGNLWMSSTISAIKFEMIPNCKCISKSVCASFRRDFTHTLRTHKNMSAMAARSVFCRDHTNLRWNRVSSFSVQKRNVSNTFFVLRKKTRRCCPLKAELCKKINRVVVESIEMVLHYVLYTIIWALTLSNSIFFDQRKIFWIKLILYL